MNVSRKIALICIALSVLALGACGGGGGNSSTPAAAPAPAPANPNTGTVGAAAVTIALPGVTNFTGGLLAPPTVGSVSSKLTAEMALSPAGLLGLTSSSTLPAGAAAYIAFSASAAVTFSGPLTLTLTPADGKTYVLVAYAVSANNALALGPPILGSVGAPIAAAASSSSLAKKASTSAPSSLNFKIPPTLFSATTYTVFVVNLGPSIASYPTGLTPVPAPTLAPGVTAVLPLDGSNAIRVFPANSSGAVAPLLLPAPPATYTSGSSAGAPVMINAVQVDEAGTVYGLDSLNLSVWTWAYGGTAAPTMLIDESKVNAKVSNTLSVASFAVNPQGSQIAFLVDAPAASIAAGLPIAGIVVYDVASGTFPQYFLVPGQAADWSPGASDLAFDAQGQIYYTDNFNLYVYAAGATGASVQPSSSFPVFTSFNSSQAPQMVVQTTSTLGGTYGVGPAYTAPGNIFAVTQAGNADSMLYEFPPPLNGAYIQEDLFTTNLICNLCNGNLLQPVPGPYSFRVQAVDDLSNIYLYSTAATTSSTGAAIAAVEYFPSQGVATGTTAPTYFWDSAAALPVTAQASIAVVPHPVIVVSPSAETLTVGQSATVSVTEGAGYAGTFTATVTPSACVSVAQVQTNQFSLTGAATGSCTVQFADTSTTIAQLSATVNAVSTVALSSPQGLAFNPLNGNLYVANAGTNQILIYSETGTTSPSFTQIGQISGTELSSPVRLAFDGSGNLFVANAVGNTVTVYDSTNTNIPGATITGLTHPLGVAVDANGFVFVGNNGANTIGVYAPSVTNTPSSGYAPVAGSPFSHDGASNAFVAPGALTFGSFGARSGVAIGVAAGVDVYLDAGATTLAGSASPVYTLGTPNGINGPTGIAISFTNLEVAVTNYYASDVTIYNMTSIVGGGTVPPAHTVSSLVSPEGVAIDSTGNVLVAQAGSNSITVYSSAATLLTTLH